MDRDKQKVEAFNIWQKDYMPIMLAFLLKLKTGLSIKTECSMQFKLSEDKEKQLDWKNSGRHLLPAYCVEVGLVIEQEWSAA